jgi:hypothetical protein
VFLVTLICSDRACADEVDVVLDDLRGLDAACCDCGCAQVLVAIAEWEAAPVAALA